MHYIYYFVSSAASAHGLNAILDSIIFTVDGDHLISRTKEALQSHFQSTGGLDICERDTFSIPPKAERKLTRKAVRGWNVSNE